MCAPFCCFDCSFPVLDASAKLMPGILQEVQVFWGSPLGCQAIEIGDAEAGESEIIYGRYSRLVFSLSSSLHSIFRLFINNRVFGLRESSECFNDGLKSNFMYKRRKLSTFIRRVVQVGSLSSAHLRRARRSGNRPSNLPPF